MIFESGPGKQQEDFIEFDGNYKVLFELNPLPMWVYDIDTYQVLNVNEAALLHYGYSKEEFLSLTIKDLRPPEHIPVLEKAIEKLKSDDKHFTTGIYKHRKKTGEVISVQVWGSRILYAGRNAELILAADVTATLAAQKEVEAATKKLHDAQVIAKLGYWSRKMGDDISDWSEKMYAIYGRDPSTFVPSYENVRLCFHPDDRHLLDEEAFQTLAETGIADYEHRIVTENGEIRWVFQRLHLECDEDGRPILVNGIIRDTTERVRQQNQLRISEKRYKALAQEGADLVGIMEKSGKCIFVADSILPVLGFAADKLVGTNLFDYIHPADKARVTSQVQSLLPGEKTKIDPYRFPDVNGSWRWISTMATNLTHEEAVGGIVINSTEITDLLNKSNALKTSNDRYKLLMKAANQAVYDWDITQGTVDWGEGLTEIFGYKFSSPDPSVWSVHICAHDKERVIQQVNEAKNDPAKEMIDIEYGYTKADGCIAVVEHRIIFLRNEEGIAVRAIGHVKDATAYRKNLQRIHQQNETLTRIAWTQSHVVRAPLARIMGLVALLKDGEYEELTPQELLDHVYRSACELDKVIREIVHTAETTHEPRN
ncbi:PAS domain-containing protein [Dyadobacter crusticola]|uniref:PAS domain-containing protein n=1 Tax=Dyadobacter crusticola TaxID=292407 RepID=UPI0004E13E34|nr:PAS domain-containing protein [Dyadobacter crusticola]